MYIWERRRWPNFEWDEKAITEKAANLKYEQGRLLGKMEALGFDLRNEANLQTLTQDVLKSSEIEGKRLDSDQVRSSIARRLGLDIAGLVPADRDVEGIVEMMLDATGNYRNILNKERLFGWHAALFPTGRSGMFKIIAGNWRDDRNGPMQVVSGPAGKEKVHFEAPPAKALSREMKNFLDWLNHSSKLDPLLKAGISHLWFVTLHPFEDGNGRIARSIADMMLARGEKTPQRFYSMSAEIRKERNEYYEVLERTQKGDLDITLWLEWFLECLFRAIDGSKETLKSVLRKAGFWEKFKKEPLNKRQIKILNRLLDDFEGKLTSSKWARLAKCSQDTATRDIQDLINKGALRKNPEGGRSTSYSLVDEEEIKELEKVKNKGGGRRRTSSFGR